MNTSSDHSQGASHAPSQLMASSAPSSGGKRENSGTAGLPDTPTSMAFRPRPIRMPSRSTAFAAWDIEDDDEKW